MVGGGAACRPGQVDVNTTSAEDLEAIVVDRSVAGQPDAGASTVHGLPDIVRVDGIGEATMSAITEGGLACAS